ncbi:MAG: TIGR00730 family Rossman fold protein [Alphaproteobacteria bacterium]|nr:TIGR00730 family Rossman fold protein [Alphaproteobacteria bacterium]
MTSAITPPKRICVFCGSSSRVDQRYKRAATDLGTLIAQAGCDLVYGGGKVGLMGLLADAALSAGGKVVGVIPSFLRDLEVGHGGATELIVTDSMHSRKREMYERSDAFVTLPGGLGTLDETLEVLTWTQLNLSAKPVVLVDIAGYWQPLIDLIDHTVREGFARPENRAMLTVVDRVEDVLPTLATLTVPEFDLAAKWV